MTTSKPPPEALPDDAGLENASNDAIPDGPDPDIAALVQRIRASKDPNIQVLLPLSEDASERITNRVLGFGAKDGGRVVPFPSTAERASRLRRAMWAGATALALAAGVGGLYVTTRGPSAPRVTYALEISGDAAVRSNDHASEGPVHLRPSTRLRARLTPNTRVRDKALRVLVVRGGKAALVTPAYTFASDGAVVIDAMAHEALGDQVDGPADLVFIVGSALPDDDEIKRLAEDPKAQSEGNFDVLRRPAILEGWGSTKRGIEPVDIEFAGCHALTAGPVCEVLKGAKLRFWVPNAVGLSTILINGQAIASTREPVQGGTRLSVDLADDAKEAVIMGESNEVLLRLPIRPALDLPAVREAFTLMQMNKLDEAEKKLEAAERDERPEAKLQALRKRARLERRRGNIDKTMASLKKAIDEGHAAGRTSDEIEDRHLLGYQEMLQHYDFAAARRDFFEALPLESTCPELRVDGDYYRAVWATEAGRMEEALRWLRRSQASAERLLLPEQAAAAKSMLIETLSVLGRRSEVQALVDDSLKDAASSADPCMQTRFVTNAAWALFRGADAEEAAFRAKKTATDAVDIAKTRCPEMLPITLVNLAFATLKTKNVTEARTHLNEAQRTAAKDDARFQSWSDALAIELELAEEPTKALSVAENLLQRGEEAMSPELFFYASSTRARALDTLGRMDLAIQAFEAGETALDQWSAWVPLGEGRSAFLTQQDQWSRIAVGFYARRAEAETPNSPARAAALRTAAEVARRSLARFFGTLVTTETIPTAEIGVRRKSQEATQKGGGPEKKRAPIIPNPRIPEGTNGFNPLARGQTLSILYHPVPEGWVGFAIEPDGTITMKQLPRFQEDVFSSSGGGLAGTDLSAALLAPFADPINRAKRLRFSGPTKLMRLAFEALPWKDGVLGDVASVSYGFDASVSVAEHGCQGAHRALVVTNPQGDLAGAESTGAGTRKTLLALGWKVDWLEGSAAKREAVLAALQDPCTTIFHYDGHARFEGRDGLRAALMLRDDALTVSDLLSLPRVPQAIVLLGCATAKDEGLGLAQAFLQRGSREVLATTDDVDDTLSQRIAERLYDGAPAASVGPPELAMALRAALKSANHSGGGDPADPSRFRVLTR